MAWEAMAATLPRVLAVAASFGLGAIGLDALGAELGAVARLTAHVAEKQVMRRAALEAAQASVKRLRHGGQISDTAPRREPRELDPDEVWLELYRAGESTGWNHTTADDLWRFTKTPSDVASWSMRS